MRMRTILFYFLALVLFLLGVHLQTGHLASVMQLTGGATAIGGIVILCLLSKPAGRWWRAFNVAGGLSAGEPSEYDAAIQLFRQLGRNCQWIGLLQIAVALVGGLVLIKTPARLGPGIATGIVGWIYCTLIQLGVALSLETAARERKIMVSGTPPADGAVSSGFSAGRILSIVLALAVGGWALLEVGTIPRALQAVQIFVLIGPVFVMTWIPGTGGFEVASMKSATWRVRLLAFARSTLWAGTVGFAIGLIGMMMNLDNPGDVYIHLGRAALSPLCGLGLALFFLALAEHWRDPQSGEADRNGEKDFLEDFIMAMGMLLWFAAIVGTVLLAIKGA